MADLNGEDVERLASRLAMMVSEDGEAANAGRAVAQLARRLGLTGGELKEMFLHGAAGPSSPHPAPPHPAPISGVSREEVEALERELATLRKGLRLMEANHRDLEYERDALFSELVALRTRAENARSTSQLRYALVGVVVLALAGAGSVGFLMSVDEPPRPPASIAPARPAMVVPGQAVQAPSAAAAAPAGDYGPVTRRVGVVRIGRAVAHRAPDRNAAALATLQSGMPVVVRRVFFNAETQWAEVEIGSAIGYVLTTDIDLS